MPPSPPVCLLCLNQISVEYRASVTVSGFADFLQFCRAYLQVSCVDKFWKNQYFASGKKAVFCRECGERVREALEVWREVERLKVELLWRVKCLGDLIIRHEQQEIGRQFSLRGISLWKVKLLRKQLERHCMETIYAPYCHFTLELPNWKPNFGLTFWLLFGYTGRLKARKILPVVRLTKQVTRSESAMEQIQFLVGLIILLSLKFNWNLRRISERKSRNHDDNLGFVTVGDGLSKIRIPTRATLRQFCALILLTGLSQNWHLETLLKEHNFSWRPVSQATLRDTALAIKMEGHDAESDGEQEDKMYDTVIKKEPEPEVETPNRLLRAGISKTRSRRRKRKVVPAKSKSLPSVKRKVGRPVGWRKNKSRLLPSKLSLRTKIELTILPSTEEEETTVDNPSSPPILMEMDDHWDDDDSLDPDFEAPSSPPTLEPQESQPSPQEPKPEESSSTPEKKTAIPSLVKRALRNFRNNPLLNKEATATPSEDNPPQIDPSFLRSSYVPRRFLPPKPKGRPRKHPKRTVKYSGPGRPRSATRKRDRSAVVFPDEKTVKGERYHTDQKEPSFGFVLKCEHCPELKFFRVFLLEEHRRQTHTENPDPLICSICQYSCTTYNLLVEHVEKTHENILEKRLFCLYCSEIFTTPEQRSLHQRNLHWIYPPELYCEVDDCPEKCMTTDSLFEHLKSHGNTPTRCDLCQWPFLDPHLLRLHKITHMPKCYENPTNVFACPLCNFESHENAELIKHWNETHLPSPRPWFECPDDPLCKTTFYFPTAKYLQWHQSLHERHQKVVLPFPAKGSQFSLPCMWCREEYLKLGTRQIHERSQCLHRPSEQKQKRFPNKLVCNQCDFSSTTSRKHIVRHLTTHLKNWFECAHCPVKFRKRVHRECHVQRLHTRENLHVCHLCGRACPNQYELKYHLKTHEKAFMCTECGKTFTRGWCLSLHMRQHNGQRLQCRFCPRLFIMEETLKKHLMKEHPTEYYKDYDKYTRRRLMYKLVTVGKDVVDDGRMRKRRRNEEIMEEEAAPAQQNTVYQELNSVASESCQVPSVNTDPVPLAPHRRPNYS